MASSTVLLEDLIQSYQRHREDEYRVREKQHHGTVVEQRERDRAKIVGEQKECVHSIQVFKEILNEQIANGDQRARTFKKVVQCLEEPCGEEGLPLYKSYGINKGNFTTLLKFGKELLAREQFEKALHFFRVLTYLDQSNTEAKLGLSLVFLLDNKIDESLSFAWKAHLNDPKNVAPALCTLMCLEQMGNWDEVALLVEDLQKVKGELSRPTRKLIDEHARMPKNDYLNVAEKTCRVLVRYNVPPTVVSENIHMNPPSLKGKASLQLPPAEYSRLFRSALSELGSQQ